MSWNPEEAVSYYRRQGAPGDQSASIALLKEIQAEFGHIPSGLLPMLAESLSTKEGYFLALIRRIPSLRLAEGNCKMEVSPYYSSTVYGLERVADHLVNIGYSIVNPIGSQTEN